MNTLAGGVGIAESANEDNATESRLTSYGKLWQAMASYGKLWQAMASYGKLWQAMASYGKLWQAMAS
jgi:hypothetical protein